MTTKVITIASIGLENYFVVVEADMSRSLPGIEIVGLPDSAVKEAKERIKSSFMKREKREPAATAIGRRLRRTGCRCVSVPILTV